MKDITKELGFKAYTRINDQAVANMNVRVDGTRFRLSVDTAKELKLDNHSHVEVLSLDEKKWYLAKSVDAKNAYLVTRTGGRSGMSFNAAKITRRILMDLVPGRTEMLGILEKTNYEYKGHTVWQIKKRIA